jgi:hypothetical protein
MQLSDNVQKKAAYKGCFEKKTVVELEEKTFSPIQVTAVSIPCDCCLSFRQFSPLLSFTADSTSHQNKTSNPGHSILDFRF